jgi:hypothetical protein
MRRDPAPWNHNIHYQPLILATVPGGCRRCLDVGWPGARYRRHLLWRYSLVWTKPTSGASPVTARRCRGPSSGC